MVEKPKVSRFLKRPLLVASFGAAAITVASCGGFPSGNLIAPMCPDGGIDRGDNCMPRADGGTDAGTKDGGPTDAGGKDGGDGGMGGDS